MLVNRTGRNTTVRECVDFYVVSPVKPDNCVQIRKFGLAGQLVFPQNRNCAIVTLSAGVLDWLLLISQAGYLREVSGLCLDQGMGSECEL
jgi:hypothetical protein